MWQQLPQGLVPHTTLHYIGILMCASHNLHPLFVDVLKPLGFLKEEINPKKYVYID